LFATHDSPEWGSRRTGSGFHRWKVPLARSDLKALKFVKILIGYADLVLNATSMLMAQILTFLGILVRHNPVDYLVNPYAYEYEHVADIKLQLLKIHPEWIITSMS
jgi:hypothetical protein